MRFDPEVCMRHFDSDEFAHRRDVAWFDRMVTALPWQWQEEIRRRWLSKWSPVEALRRPANLEVLERVAMLTDAQRAGLRPDSTDADVRKRADLMARHFTEGMARRKPEDQEPWARDSMARSGLADFWPRAKELAGALGRLKCPLFWRRVLRGLLAKTSEACAIGMGLVHKRNQKYSSDLAVQRKRGQAAANRAMMGKTFLQNEYGQQVSIEDLANKSQANQGNRFSELMVRISGMDLMACDLGHEAMFVTVTCPSRMHARMAGTGQENPNYDGTLPNKAQAYLCAQWKKLGLWLKRRGVSYYGFRIAEPHHDACPHWHLLLFFKPDAKGGASASGVIKDGFRQYFLLNDSPDELGAARYRLKFEPIDRERGSAAGYIAKYITKNTKGLDGIPQINPVERVQVWSSNWGIRQFQQVGGVPVGPWRELRRINPQALEGAPLPEALTQALHGVNVGQVGEKWAEGYQAYAMAQGGPFVSRKAQAIKLLKQETGELTRYGEVRAKDVIGVECSGWNAYRREDMVAMLGQMAPVVMRPAMAQIETERCQWHSVTRAQVRPEQERKARAEGSRPWTRVNNCTLTHWTDGQTGRDVAVVSRSKTGNFRGWKAKDGPPVDQTEHEGA